MATRNTALALFARASAGPGLHCGAARWWGPLAWLPQLRGGGERYAGQQGTRLHLIEKTRQEAKLGFNF